MTNLTYDFVSLVFIFGGNEGCVFSLFANTLISLAKKRGLTVGIFVALHTYGWQVNFNCHLHLSIAEFVLNRHEKLKTFTFKFGLLMKQWPYGIINLLRTQYSALIFPSELAKEGDSLQFWNVFLNKHYNRVCCKKFCFSSKSLPL